MGGGTTRAWGQAGIVLALVGTLGCDLGERQARTGPQTAEVVLRVGLSPDAAPIAFMRDQRIVGIEPDLAQALVDYFHRPLVLVPMEWDSLIPALLDGRIDAIMSGMTITPARQVRVAFANPYMHSGLGAATRRGQADRFRSLDSMLSASVNVGVRSGSTAESWVRANMRYAITVPYPNIQDAARELSQNRLDMIVSDIPQVAWAVSEYTGNIEVVRVRLTHEDIAWAFRPQDTRLRDAANGALATWQQNGRLHAILQRWIPYIDDLDRWR